MAEYKRIYFETVKRKWKELTGLTITGTISVFLLFWYLSSSGLITVNSYSYSQYCEGTEEDLCWAIINFTAKKDIYIYPLEYDPYGRNTPLEFNPGVKEWHLYRSWGKGWREINLSKTWSKKVNYAVKFAKGKTYLIKITALKNNPYWDNIKWSFTDALDPWWNSSWSYRQPINISNTAGDLTNYQVRIDLNSSNVGANFDWDNNGSDIRFTNASDDLLNFWIESWNSSSQKATIWVNVTSLPNNTNTTIYMYYGNSFASSESDGNVTFDFFDDFYTLETGNPVMDEDTYEKDAAVWYDYENDTYYIYFTYRSNPSSATNTYISMRTTNDHFKTYSSRTDIWNHYAAPSNIVKRGSTYYMFFQSYPDSADEKGYCRIFYSTSTNLINWTTPALAFERTTGWNGGTKRAIDPNLYKEGDTWYLFYVGKDGTKNAVGYATTSDTNFPTGWVDQTTSEPLLTPTKSWEGSIIEAITVWKLGDTYYMLYSGGVSPQQPGLATAENISGPWTRYGSDGRVDHASETWSSYSWGQYDILKQGAESWRSGEHWNDNKYHIIFQGRHSSSSESWSIGLASSENLINYTNLQAKWTKSYSSGVETNNSYLRFMSPIPTNNILKGVVSNNSFNPSSHALVCKVWGKPNNNDDFFAFGWYKDDENNYKVDFGPSNSRSWDIGVGGLVNNSWYGITGYDNQYNQESYYTLQLRKIGTTIYLDVDDVNKLTKSNDGFTFSDTKVGMNIWAEEEWRVDWILVRKYADPEPTVSSFGSEESGGGETTFSITLNSPPNQTTTDDSTPDFNFTVSGTESSYSCELFINDTGYGTATANNNTATIITANQSLSDGTYEWYINCSANSVTNQSETREITIDTAPVLTFKPPTEPNGTTVPRNWTEVNITIDDPDGNLDTFKFNWNGTNYTFYDDSLVLALNFNNNSAIGENSTYAVDISQYGNNGTIHGATWTNGKFGSALEFDGVDDYVSVPDDESLDITDTVTIEVWINPQEQNSGGLSLKQIAGKRAQYVMYISRTGYTISFYTYPDGTVSALSSLTTLTEGKWSHVVCVLDENGRKIYINGELDNSDSTAGTQSQIYPVGIGGDPNSPTDRAFNGTIDELRIYNRALSAEEIKMHYLSEFQKYNSTQWRFYNNLTDLEDGTYTYYGWANDTSGNEGQSEVREITIGQPDIKIEIWNGTDWILFNDTNLLEFRCEAGQTECEPTNQDVGNSQSIFKITNNGTGDGAKVEMKLNQTFTDITLKCDDDYTYADAVEITSSYQQIHGALSTNSYFYVSCWADYGTNPQPGYFDLLFRIT